MRGRSVSMHDVDLRSPIARHARNEGLLFWWMPLPHLYGSINRTYELTGKYVGAPATGSILWSTNSPPGMNGSVMGTGSFNVSFGNLTAIEGLSYVVLSAWMYRSASGQRAVIGRNSNLTDRFSIQWHSDNTCYFLVDTGSGASFESIAFNTTGWHYFEMVYDGSQAAATDRIQGYIDGTLRATTLSGTPPTTVPVDANPWYLNVANNTLGAGALGHYADVRVSTAKFTGTLYNEARNGYPNLLRRRRQRIVVEGESAAAAWDASQWARFVEERPDRNQGRRAVAY